MRSDARDNRDRIMAAASRAFAEDGAISMNQIAQRAGVGAGTLYRNFPTREDLVLAVYQQEVQRLVDSVPDLLAELPPVEALRAWTLELVAAMRRKHGLGDALTPRSQQQITERSYEPVVGAIAALLDAGTSAGVLRPDVDPTDFLQLTAAMWRAATEPVDRAPVILDLILDGLART